MPKKMPGLYKNGVIYLDKQLSPEKSVEILAEEIGHHFTSAGDITDYSKIENMKQEVRARRFGHELIITFDGLIEAWSIGVHNIFEMAIHFGVTEEYIFEAIEHYKQRHGLSTIHGDYLIRFDPLMVYKYKDLRGE
nr:ImmA/IrrE family metallo-endopeptidase [Macrococcus hajekii]